MKLSTIKGVITSKMARKILVTQKHSPAILFGAGVVGVVATVVLASRATLKVDEVLSETHDTLEKIRSLDAANYSEQDRKKDITLTYAKTANKLTRLYGPAAIVGVASIAALTGSHFILSRRNVALTAAYAALDKGFREYRNRVVGILGEDADRQFRHGASEQNVVEEVQIDDGQVVRVTKVNPKASIYARFFDSTNRNWERRPTHNQMFIQCQQNWANDKLRAQGHLFLNEVYDMLGLDRTKEGAIVGWVMGNGDDFVDFGVFEGDRESGMRFVMGHEASVLLDFNVDGIIYDKI